jgi:chromosomal replication initiator protein
MQCKKCPIPGKICWCEFYPPMANNITIKDVIRVTCKQYNILQQLFLSRSRRQDVAEARQIAMYVCERFLGATLTDIGKEMNRYHATVLHGIKKVQADRELLNKAKFIYSNVK